METKYLLKGNTLFHLKTFTYLIKPNINSLSIRTYKTFSDVIINNKNSLAHDVLNHLLINLKTNKKIIPKISVSRQAKLASESLSNMISTLESRNNNIIQTECNPNRLFNEIKLLTFITEYYNLPIYVVSKDIEGSLYSEIELKLPVQIPKFTTLISEDNNKDKFLKRDIR